MPAILVFIAIVAIFAGASIYRDSSLINDVFKKAHCIIDSSKCPQNKEGRPDTERKVKNSDPSSN